MGSPQNEMNRLPSEGPQHEVTIATVFAVSKYEVTFDDWQACVDYGNCNRNIDDNHFEHHRRPVINVNWFDAQGYAKWLSGMTGKNYRLLTEAEYEYAARAGTRTTYPWGNELNPAQNAMANCKIQKFTRIRCGSEWDGKAPAPVGSFLPNQFGLYDMVGNVWEWVEDCDHQNYDGAPNNGVVWVGGNCGAHMMRGGAFDFDQEHIRVARRGVMKSEIRYPDISFRVARSLL
jgi:formylglycine-generating enzyme required for sulfatase activity